MIVDVPEGKDPIRYVWGEMVPGIGVPASKFSMSVYEHSTLGLREFEAARLRVAQINGCLFCQDWRTERDGVQVEAPWARATVSGQTSSGAYMVVHNTGSHPLKLIGACSPAIKSWLR